MIIHEIDVGFAHVQIDGVDYELLLSDECERHETDDYRTQIFYDEHTPIITDIHQINMDDGTLSQIDDDIKCHVLRHVANHDEFFKAYQDLFDLKVSYGKSVANCY